MFGFIVIILYIFIMITIIDPISSLLYHISALVLIYTIGGCTDGDKVNDTPAEAKAYQGCDCSIVRDTCPTKSGFDQE